MYREVARRYRAHCRQSSFRTAVLLSASFFIFSIVVSFYAIGYTDTHASNGVTDIVLSNIPVFDVDGLFVYGTLVFIAFVTFLCLIHPKRIPFILNSLGLFWLIRSGFTSLTHIGPFPTQTPFNLDINLGTVVSRFFIGNDFFFSGHVGTPFLLSLIFWEQKWLRGTFLIWSVYFGVIVLLGHLHYSIDVASAFFISYSIYHLALWLFPASRTLFLSK